MPWTSHPVAGLSGVLRAPGDKSCSHRALILGGLAEGTSTFDGLLDGDDVLRTGDAMAALGAGVTRLGPGRWRMTGVGGRGLSSPGGVLDFGNSGTGSRLMMGAMAGHDLTARLTGDDSLRRRPMNRILEPLRQMGLVDTAAPDGRLPFEITGRRGLAPIDYTPPVASAQVKSAILLAALGAEGTSTLREARTTRDHTEKMLRGFGVRLTRTATPGGGQTVTLAGGQALTAIETEIPGDPSSAAFALVASAVAARGSVLVEGVLSNETRDGLVQALALMGAPIGAEATGEAAGERLVDLQAEACGLKGIVVPERLVASMIDEFPILAVAAAFATGETVVSGAEELRVKESDRIAAIVAMLRANGVEAEERPDGFAVQGCGGPPPGGGLVETRHDHRIAMSALVMGTASKSPVSVDDISMIATSYPAFLADMTALGADIREGQP